MKTWTETSNGFILNEPSIDSVDQTQALSALRGTQETESENHPGWLQHKEGAWSGDLGGPFYTKKRYAKSTNIDPVFLDGKRWDGTSRWNHAEYMGPMLPASPRDMVYPPFAISSNDSLDEQGTIAISRCSPSNSVADVSTFLGETLREGIPKLGGLLFLRSKTNRERRKALGSEFLNHQFGWMPFLNDVNSVSNSIIRADAIWAQYERDSGRGVRRSYDFPVVESDSYADLGTIGPWTGISTSRFADLNAPLDGKVIRSDHTTKRQWFRGMFTYFLPKDREGLAYQVIQARKLLGLTLTPDTIWSLSPWSWAVDWFTNTSEVLENWSNWAINGQVLLYGYMMEHSIVERTYTYVGHTRYQRADVRPPAITLVSEAKVRRVATPYGFGITWNGFSAIQAAIVAALGLSKGK